MHTVIEHRVGLHFDQIRVLYLFQSRVLGSGKTFDPGKLDRRHVCEASTGLVY